MSIADNVHGSVALNELSGRILNYLESVPAIINVPVLSIPRQGEHGIYNISFIGEFSVQYHGNTCSNGGK